MTTKKHYFNFENITIRGNIGSDVSLKAKNKERIEFLVAVNKSQSKQITKWFKVLVFNENVVSAIKNNPGFKKGANVEVQGEVHAEVYNNKSVLKIFANQVILNIKTIEKIA